MCPTEDIHRLPWNDEEVERAKPIEDDTPTPTGRLKSLKEERLIVLRTLLKKRQDRALTTRPTATSRIDLEKNGQNLTGSMSVQLNESGMQERKAASPPKNTEPQTLQKPMSAVVEIVASSEQPLALLEEKSSSTPPSSEIIASQSMSLLDESANHMLDLMKGLHANQPPAEVRAFDPERVNSAVACANTIYKIMRLKLDAIKVQRKIK